MKDFKRVKRFDIPIYCGVVYFCKTRSAWKEVRKHFKLPPPPARVTGCTSSIERGMDMIYVVYVGNGKYSTLAHEMSHVALDVFNDVGIEIVKGESNEYFTYLLEELMNLAGRL